MKAFRTKTGTKLHRVHAHQGTTNCGLRATSPVTLDPAKLGTYHFCDKCFPSTAPEDVARSLEYDARTD